MQHSRYPRYAPESYADWRNKLKKYVGKRVDSIFLNAQRRLRDLRGLKDLSPNSLHNFDVEVPFMAPVIAKVALY